MTETESLEIQGLQRRALELWVADQASALELGRALIAVRGALRDERGAFTAWYRANDLEENRVYYCIRKAEGKEKRPAIAQEELPTFVLNDRNLAIAKYAPKTETKFMSKTVHVCREGTTVTDGFKLIRVSLPPQLSPPEHEGGVVPATLLSRIATANASSYRISFKHDEVIAKTDDENITIPRNQTEFPSIDKVLGQVARQDIVFKCTVTLAALSALVNSAKEFNPDRADLTEEIALTFYKDTVRLDTDTVDGQTWLGIAKLVNG
jgi:hypothetical protein